MLKRMILTWLSAVLMLSMLTSTAKAEGGTVQVRIAGFPVKVNGQIINNKQAAYPFVVYKDITYVPLNWDLIQELELDVDWSEEEGLKVYKTCCISRHWKYPALEKSKFTQNPTTTNSLTRTYSAKVTSYPIQLWGQQIDNGQEPYPFLEFRSVTYMPLTWQFAHMALMMDLQWSSEEGLAIWSGQDAVMRQIVYDDAEALYVDADRGEGGMSGMLKVDKAFQAHPEWLDPPQADAIRDKAKQAAEKQVSEGKSVVIQRDGDQLSYEGLPLGQVHEDDKINLGGTELQIQGTLYDIDNRRKLLAVYSYFPLPVMGPAPHSRYQLFAIIGGSVRKVSNYPYMPQRVLKNDDGTVWIARDLMPFRNVYYGGSGLLALMDPEGNIRLANEVLNEQDIIPVGLGSPTRNAADRDGRMIVRLFGRPYKDGKSVVYGARGPGLTPVEPFDAEKDGFYEVTPDLKLKRLAKAPDQQDNLTLYLDSQGDIYTIHRYSNTLTNWTWNRYKTWTDLELLK